MFKRKKTQVQPELDPYITRRYEDLAVCIHHDLKNGRGQYSYYAPWLETMLQRLPSVEMRQKYSLLPSADTRPALAWVGGEDEAGPSDRSAAAVRKINTEKYDDGVSENSIETVYVGDQTGAKALYEQSDTVTSGVSERSKVRSGQPESADCAPPEIPPPAATAARQNRSRLCIIL